MYKIVKRIVGMYWIHNLWERKCLFNMPHGSFYISRPNINGIDRVYRKNNVYEIGKRSTFYFTCRYIWIWVFSTNKTDAWNNKKATRSLIFHDTWSFVHWPPVKAKITINIWTWDWQKKLFWRRQVKRVFELFYTGRWVVSFLFFFLVFFMHN